MVVARCQSCGTLARGSDLYQCPVDRHHLSCRTCLKRDPKLWVREHLFSLFKSTPLCPTCQITMVEGGIKKGY